MTERLYYTDAYATQFTATVTAQTGPDYAVEYSSNLVNWSTLLITNSPPS